MGVAVWVVAAGLNTPMALGQTPDPVVPAAVGSTSGNENQPVWETSVAASGSRVMAVYHIGPRGGLPHKKIGYATTSQTSPPYTWSEGVIAPTSEGDFFDPVVVYSPAHDDFIVLAIRRNSSGCTNDLLVFIRYGSPSNPFAGGWEVVPGVGCSNLDKPWIVAGEVFSGSANKQEYYVLYMEGGDRKYARIVDTGTAWNTVVGMIATIDGLTVGAFPQPAVHQDRPVYVAYAGSSPGSSAARIRVLEGKDKPNGEVGWSHLIEDCTTCDTPKAVEFVLRARVSGVGGALSCFIELPAGYPQNFPMIPQIATDPVDPAKLYLVWFDLATGLTYEETGENCECPSARDTDVNVYFARLERQANGRWKAFGMGSEPPGQTPLNDNIIPDEEPTDQSMPVITVTPGPPNQPSRVHVVWYDSRRFTVLPGGAPQRDCPRAECQGVPSCVRYDAFYRASETGGNSWRASERLARPSPDHLKPLVDFGLAPPPFEFGDYIGITARPSGENNWEVFTTFAGTSDADTTANKSVIWSSRVLWVP